MDRRRVRHRSGQRRRKQRLLTADQAALLGPPEAPRTHPIRVLERTLERFLRYLETFHHLTWLRAKLDLEPSDYRRFLVDYWVCGCEATTLRSLRPLAVRRRRGVRVAIKLHRRIEHSSLCDSWFATISWNQDGERRCKAVSSSAVVFSRPLTHEERSALPITEDKDEERYYNSSSPWYGWAVPPPPFETISEPGPRDHANQCRRAKRRQARAMAAHELSDVCC